MKYCSYLADEATLPVASFHPLVATLMFPPRDCQVFDKAVRALESAVNRLPGMHEMGLEHLVLEEPPPPTPGTPTAGTAPTPAPGACAGGATPPFRPTAPGKTSIPWAHDAIGPLSQLARKVCEDERNSTWQGWMQGFPRVHS